MDIPLIAPPFPITIQTSSIRYGRYLQSLIGQLGLEAHIDSSSSASDEHSRMDAQSGLIIVDSGKWDGRRKRFFERNGVPAIYLIDRKTHPLPPGEKNSVFLQKPLDPPEFVTKVEELYRHPRGHEPEKLAEPYLIGNSDKIREIRKDIKRISDSDLTVLLLGETGTGKGVLALSLHNNSSRRKYPFVDVNCANIPHSLMESEFFGYKRGAFTGAWKDKIGKFQLASSGTIFLDEISEMPPSMQAKLLQVLQEGEFSPVGSVDNVHVNVRIVAATNADPKSLISSGDFRLDLYYRLAVLRFYLPALKERKEDILPLTIFFLEKYSRLYNKQFTTPTNKLWRMLEDHDWPGNVRELENTIKTLVALENEDIVIEEMNKKIQGKAASPAEAGTLEQRPTGSELRSMTLREITERESALAEKDIIRKVLQRTNGNKKKAAELLQVSYKCMLNKVKTYGL